MNFMYWLIFLLFFLSGCTSETPEKILFEKGPVYETSKNFTFPKSLVTVFENEYVAAMKKMGPPYDQQTRDELLKKMQREYLDVVVELIPKAPGVLDPMSFQWPRGGGALDLKDSVRGQKGSFFIRFRVFSSTNKESPLKNYQTYFLSLSQKKKIDGVYYGDGCYRVMNITSYLLKRQNQGLLANATDQRHVAVMSGIYYFVAFEKEKLLLAAVKITDSRFSSLDCPPMVPL